MEFRFEYDVEVPNSEIIIASVEFNEELDEDQTKRLKASYATEKYTWLDEDPSIRDIYDQIYDIAVQNEEQEEYGELVGSEVKVGFFRYPKELGVKN